MASVSERRRGGSSKFAVRIFVKKSSDFNQKVPPSFTFSEIERCCLGAKRLGMVFFRNFEGIFEVEKQFLPALESKYDKIPILNSARIKIEVLKRLVRIAHELNIIEKKKYIILESDLQEISKMTNGWIKYFK